MLKMYNVQNLRAGMIVGRDIKQPDGNILIPVGKTLDANLLKLLSKTNIFSVYIDEPQFEAISNIPGREFLLDDEYVEIYKRVCKRIKRIYEHLAIQRELLMDELGYIISKKSLDKLCDGAKAVSQIHNMTRDPNDYLTNHVVHVGILSGLMGKWLNMPFEQMQDLATAGFLHDVGMMKIPPNISTKEGKLTSEEWQKMQRHPEFSFDMLKNGPLKKKKDILEGVWQHHERCDGSGYQNRLVKDQINPYGRILAILDIYDAMASNRSYATRKSPFDVVKVLYDDVLDGKLDAEYAIPFIKQLYRCLNGNWVSLSDGQRAKIVYLNDSNPSSLPIVQTLAGQFVDLNRTKNITVAHILTAGEVG